MPQNVACSIKYTLHDLLKELPGKFPPHRFQEEATPPLYSNVNRSVVVGLR